MSQLRVYTTQQCSLCHSAKTFLLSRGIPFEEIELDLTPAARSELLRLTGRMTFPQIMIGDRPIGGFQELVALAHRGGIGGALSRAA